MKFYYCSDAGGRDRNEDSCRVIYDERGMCALVADGLGGHGGGEIASKTAADVIAKCFEESEIRRPEELNIWFQAANQSIIDIQTDDCQMKTTLAVLIIKSGMAFWAHVGDSRIYHFADGRIDSVTFDHSVSQMAVLAGEITPEEIRFHADRNKLLRALGKSGRIDVEISEAVSVEKRKHVFLICSDGFWEYVTEKEMEKDLFFSATPEQWINRMTRRRKRSEKENSDNYTAVAVFV